MNWLESRPNKHPRTASRLIDGKAVIITPEEGVVKVLNDVGSRIWELADGTHSLREIAATIYDEYDTDLKQAEDDVVEFVADMVRANLLAVEASA